MNRFLLFLWLGGGVLYAGSTFLFQDFGNPFDGDNDRLSVLPSSSPPGKNVDVEGSSPAKQRDFARSATEASRASEPGWVRFVDSVSGRSGWVHAEALKPRMAAEATAAIAPRAQVTSGSSPQAKREKKQAPSALQAKSNEAAPAKQVEASDVIADDAAVLHPTGSQKKSAEKKPQPPKIKPKAKSPSDQPKGADDRRFYDHAAFPPDEEFVPRKRRVGILARRRTFRSGPAPAPWDDDFQPPPPRRDWRPSN